MTLSTWIYAALIPLVIVLIRVGGDRWWPTTILLLTPRYLFAAPLLALIPLALRRRRLDLLAVQAATTLALLFPLMGLNLPVGTLFRKPPEGLRLRILTLNKGPAGLDQVKLATLIEREAIDIVCFQEGASLPALDAYFARGWHSTFRKHLYSRWPLSRTEQPAFNYDLEAGFYAPDLWFATVTHPKGRSFQVVSVSLPSFSWGLARLKSADFTGAAEHIAWRKFQSEQALTAMEKQIDRPMVMAGDFNLVAGSPLLAPFRNRFQFGFEDVGWGFGYTVPSFAPGVRIDHVLATREWDFVRCWVGPNVGSDHRPVIAEMVLRPER